VIIFTSCSATLSIDSYKADCINIDGQPAEWNPKSFYGLSGKNIFVSSMYNDSSIYLCMRITDNDEIMKILQNGVNISYKSGGKDFSFKMMTSDFIPIPLNNFLKKENTAMNTDTASMNIAFTPVSGFHMGKQHLYKGCMKRDGGIFTIEAAIPYDSIKENGFAELTAVISGVKNSKPSDMKKAKQGPGDGGQMPPPGKNRAPDGPPPGMNNPQNGENLSKDSIINIIVKFK